MKLGVRMLVKYPGLTIIGGLAMAFSIWVGALVFEGVRTLMIPSLPLPGGDRIVMIKNWDVAEKESEKRALYDFGVWRGALRSVTDLGVYRDVARNLILAPEDARLVQVAEMSAVGLPSRIRKAAHRPRARRGRRAAQCATGRGARLRGLAHAVCERSWRSRSSLQIDNSSRQSSA